MRVPYASATPTPYTGQPTTSGRYAPSAANMLTHGNDHLQRQRVRRKIMPLIKIRGLPLQQDHWLEVLDRKHRYGSDLKIYHEYWYVLAS